MFVVCAAFLGQIVSSQVMRAVSDMVEILPWAGASPRDAEQAHYPRGTRWQSLANINSGTTAAVRRQESAHLPEPTTLGGRWDRAGGGAGAAVSDFPFLDSSIVLIFHFHSFFFLLSLKKKKKN